MSKFATLLQLLQAELIYQEKLLKLLSKERVAIVKLNQEELDSILEAKQALLTDADKVKQQQTVIIDSLFANERFCILEAMSSILPRVPQEEGREEIGKVLGELEQVASEIRAIGQENSFLMKRFLSLN